MWTSWNKDSAIYKLIKSRGSNSLAEALRYLENRKSGLPWSYIMWKAKSSTGDKQKRGTESVSIKQSSASGNEIKISFLKKWDGNLQLIFGYSHNLSGRRQLSCQLPGDICSENKCLVILHILLSHTPVIGTDWLFTFIKSSVSIFRIQDLATLEE